MFHTLRSFSADHLTPQPSVSESAVDYESTTRSGASPLRLPNLLPDFEESGGGIPTRSDALSRWLMGSVPARAGSVAESDAPTRPGTTYSEVRPISRDMKSRLSTLESKSILKVSPSLDSKADLNQGKKLSAAAAAALLQCNARG